MKVLRKYVHEGRALESLDVHHCISDVLVTRYYLIQE